MICFLPATTLLKFYINGAENLEMPYISEFSYFPVFAGCVHSLNQHGVIRWRHLGPWTLAPKETNTSLYSKIIYYIKQ